MLIVLKIQTLTLMDEIYHVLPLFVNSNFIDTKKLMGQKWCIVARVQKRLLCSLHFQAERLSWWHGPLLCLHRAHQLVIVFANVDRVGMLCAQLLQDFIVNSYRKIDFRQIDMSRHTHVRGR